MFGLPAIRRATLYARLLCGPTFSGNEAGIQERFLFSNTSLTMDAEFYKACVAYI